MDAENAYFQGEKLERDVYIRPPPEVGLPPGTLVKADVGVYGFTDGARRWYNKVVDVFVNFLKTTLSMIEPAFFYLKDGSGKLMAMFLVHVDDVLCTYNPNAEGCALLDSLRSQIKFGKGKNAEEGFQFCGRWYSRDADGAVRISMKSYAENLSVVPMSKERRAQEESPLDGKEHSALRGVGGQCQWLGRQGHPRLSFRASRLASNYTQPHVRDLKEANTMIRMAKRLKDDCLVFRPELNIENAVVVGVQDASFDNLKENGSQAGKELLLADPAILKGDNKLYPVSLMEFLSGRIKRVVRATLAAEAYSAGESGESIEYFRYFLAELFDPEWELARRDELAEKRKAVMVTDAISLFDALRKDGSAVKDRRLRLELDILKNIKNIEFRWVPSEMVIAGELTKEVPEEVHQYAKTVRESGLWTLGNDARAPPSKRKRALINPDAPQEKDNPSELSEGGPEEEPEPDVKCLTFFDADEEFEYRLPLLKRLATSTSRFFGEKLGFGKGFLRRKRVAAQVPKNLGAGETASTFLTRVRNSLSVDGGSKQR